MSRTALTVTWVVMLFTLASLASSLPSRYRKQAEARIMNDTGVAINYKQTAWVYCQAEASYGDQVHQYRVRWVESSGATVLPWSSHTPGPQVYTVGGGPHLPHSYLVFQPFVSTHADQYDCVLQLSNGREVHRATIRVDIA